MSNKRIFRLNRNRQVCFSFGQSLNEMVIPRYDAIHDPFLKEFFKHPTQKRLLKNTGILTKSKRFSLQQFRQRISAKGHKSPSPKTEKNRAKSEAQVRSAMDKQVPPTQIDEFKTEEGQSKTASSIRYRKVYRSRQLPSDPSPSHLSSSKDIHNQMRQQRLQKSDYNSA